MELVANIWPIVDEESLLIQRFAARAYAMDGEDAEIATTLKGLANSDFIIARQFPIPANFKFVTEHGTLNGMVNVEGFNQHEPTIIENALRTLESEKPLLQGIGVDSENRPHQNRVNVAFSKEPYIVVTFILEDRGGKLRVYSKT